MSKLINFHYGENNINTGPLKGLPISIDYFYGDALNSSVFFLSHAHTDHLVGLETDEFLRRLKQPGIRLYCHPLTPILLGSFERYLGGPKGIRELISKGKIVPLDVNKKLRLSINQRGPSCSPLAVDVTLLPAGHCPGSVMFLFELQRPSPFRILHTGDFRLEEKDFEMMPALLLDPVNKVPKRIDHLYVDSTFCSLSANLFPNRKEVLSECMEDIKSWIGKSRNHVIELSFAAKFAHEYVLLEIFRKFQQKIHVLPERKAIYKHIPELDEIVTSDTDYHTQFHLCKNSKCVKGGRTLTVRFSCMWFTKSKNKKPDYVRRRGDYYLDVCYSMHSSLEEICKTIDFFKPKIVTPLVLPKYSTVAEIEKAIRSVTSFQQFEFQDYYSSRKDTSFEEEMMEIEGESSGTDQLSEYLTAIERDDSYIPAPKREAQEEDEEEEDDDELMNTSDNSDPFQLPLEPSPAKRTRPLDPEKAIIWQFKFSPSPKSSYSQDSTSSSESSSQEQDSGIVTSQAPISNQSPFLPPPLPTSSRRVSNPKRNLKTDFDLENGVSSGSPINCDNHTFVDGVETFIANNKHLNGSPEAAESMRNEHDDEDLLLANSQRYY